MVITGLEDLPLTTVIPYTDQDISIQPISPTTTICWGLVLLLILMQEIIAHIPKITPGRKQNQLRHLTVMQGLGNVSQKHFPGRVPVGKKLINADLYHIKDQQPYEVIDPDQPDQLPGDGRHQVEPALPAQQARKDLGAEDGRH